jgi:hypothetical protein
MGEVLNNQQFLVKSNSPTWRWFQRELEFFFRKTNLQEIRNML